MNSVSFILVIELYTSYMFNHSVLLQFNLLIIIIHVIFYINSNINFLLMIFISHLYFTLSWQDTPSTTILSRNDISKCFVITPREPAPIKRLSAERAGITSAAVPVRKTSSAT